MYRIITNNDVMKIITKDKTIKLTLLNREGGDISSEIFVEVYIHKKREGYDVPQFVGEPDFHEFVDVFRFEDMIIWGTKELVDISEDLEEQVHWYFDKGEL